MMNNTNARVALGGLLVAGAVIGGAVAGAAPSVAATVSPHATRTVCAQDLYVRKAPQSAIIGTLYKGDHFDVQRTSPSGQYTFGHAYGNVHQDGWVQSGHFC